MAGSTGVCLAPKASVVVASEERSAPRIDNHPSAIDEVIDGSTPPPFGNVARDPKIGSCRANTKDEPIASGFGQLRDDDDDLKCRLHRFVRGQGVRAANLELAKLRSKLEAFRSLRGDPARANRIQRVLGKLEALLAPLAAERDAFVAQLQPKVAAHAFRALDAAEERMTAARTRYGLVDLRSERGTRYAATNRAAIEDLGLAATAIRSQVAAVDAVRVRLFGIDTATKRPQYEALGMSQGQALAYVAKAEHDLTKTLQSAADVHPILASFAAAGRLSEAMERIAEGGAIRLLAETVFSSLEDVETTRAMIEDDPNRVWQLPKVVEGAVLHEGIDARSMGASHAREAVQNAKRDRRFIDNAIAATAVGLGALAMMTPAGWGLLVLTAAATAVDAAQAYRSVEHYRLQSAAAGIDPDPNRALAVPSNVIWVVVDVAAAAAGAAGVAKGLMQSPFVRAMAADDAFRTTAQRIATKIGDGPASKIFDAIGQSAFERLARDLSGEQLVKLVNGREAEVVRFLAEGVDASSTSRLLTKFHDPTIALFKGELNAKQIALAESELGDALMKSLVHGAGAETVRDLHLAFGPKLRGRATFADGAIVVDGLAKITPDALLAMAKTDGAIKRLFDGVEFLASKSDRIRTAVAAIGEHVPRLLSKLQAPQLIGLATKIDTATLNALADATPKQLLEITRLPKSLLPKLAAAGLSGQEIAAFQKTAGKAAGTKLHALANRHPDNALRALFDQHGATQVAEKADEILAATKIAKTDPGEAAGITSAVADAANVSKVTLRLLDRIKQHQSILGSEELGLVDAAINGIKKGSAPSPWTAKRLRRIGQSLNEPHGSLESIIRTHSLTRPPLAKDSVVVDTQLIIARDKVARNASPSPGDRQQAATLAEMLSRRDVRVADLTAGTEAPSIVPKNVRGVAITVDRTSDTYQSVFRVLTRYAVGKRKGGRDRELIADALFAKTSEGAMRVVVTSDKDVWTRLARIAEANQSALRPIDVSKPFQVTINGHSIRVVPK